MDQAHGKRPAATGHPYQLIHRTIYLLAKAGLRPALCRLPSAAGS